MWFLLGGLAIIFTLINLILFAFGKDYKWSMALGLSFTALTLCAENSQVNIWVQAEDWGALKDVVPTMKNVL